MSSAPKDLQPHQVFDIDGVPQGASKCFDDDGRLKRTGNFLYPSTKLSKLCVFIYLLIIIFFKELLSSFSHVICQTGTFWTASAHIITAVIGSGVLSLAWATAQLGWIAGPAVLFLFSFVTYYTSVLLSSCYRTGDSVTGKRNYTYMDAVRSNLGTFAIREIWVESACEHLSEA